MIMGPKLCACYPASLPREHGLGYVMDDSTIERP